MNFKSIKKLFKRKHPYSPVTYIGRKNVEEILGADITKRKKLIEEQKQKEGKVSKEVKSTSESNGAKKAKKKAKK